MLDLDFTSLYPTPISKIGLDYNKSTKYRFR